MNSLTILAQSPAVTNWLTPVWILSVGISIGFILSLFGLAKIWAFSKIPGLNKIGESNSATYIVAAIVLSLVYSALGFTLNLWASYEFQLEDENIRKAILEQSPLFLAFLLPVSFALGFGVWRLITSKGAREAISLTKEGLLFWVSMICLSMFAFALAGYGLAANDGFGIVKFVDEPNELIKSLVRIPQTGLTKVEQEVPPTENKIGGTKIPVDFLGEECLRVLIKSDQPLEIAVEPISKEVASTRIFSVTASSDLKSFLRRADGTGPIPDGQIDQFYVVNIGNRPANLELLVSTQPVLPQVKLIPMVALFVVLFYSLYWCFAVLTPKTFAIAFSTFKTEVNQPLFLVILVSGLFFITLSIWIPYNTFGEDIKMYKDSGLSLIRVLAIFVAIWSASKSVAEEIDGRTALTVLSKPVGRRQFILGKFSGISLMIGLLLILLGTWFMIWTAYKPIYDGREGARGLIDWQIAFNHSIGMAPAIFLVFLEVVIFVGLSVAISTRLGALANFLICFSIYVLGHLTPLIVQSSVGEFEIVQAFGNLTAIVLPVLDHFDVQAAINTERIVPTSYIGWAVIYCVLYGAISMLIALVLFEDRDLA